MPGDHDRLANAEVLGAPRSPRLDVVQPQPRLDVRHPVPHGGHQRASIPASIGSAAPVM
jgi:hypothetical protein